MGQAKNTNQYVSDPRQNKFMAAYYDPASPTFSNAYQSALQSGYSKATAKDLLHNRPKWLSVSTGRMRTYEPEQLLEKLAVIIDESSTKTTDKLKAIELLMKHYRMLTNRVEVDQRQVTIEMALNELR